MNGALGGLCDPTRFGRIDILVNNAGVSA